MQTQIPHRKADPKESSHQTCGPEGEAVTPKRATCFATGSRTASRSPLHGAIFNHPQFPSFLHRTKALGQKNLMHLRVDVSPNVALDTSSSVFPKSAELWHLRYSPLLLPHNGAIESFGQMLKSLNRVLRFPDTGGENPRLLLPTH